MSKTKKELTGNQCTNILKAIMLTKVGIFGATKLQLQKEKIPLTTSNILKAGILIRKALDNGEIISSLKEVL